MNREELQSAFVDLDNINRAISLGSGCYECRDCEYCYKCDYCRDCLECDYCKYCCNCYKCIDCDSCRNCILCKGIAEHTSGYWLLNKEISKEEFDKTKELLCN